MLLDYEFFLDNDDFTVVTSVIREDTDFHPLEPTSKFLSCISSSYRNKKCVNKQAEMDIPRQLCLINNNVVHSYSEFVNNIGYTHLLDEALLLSTQATMAPILDILAKQYKGSHIADFSNDNPLTFKFWVHEIDNLQVEISKKFRVFQLDDDCDIINLKILIVNMCIEISKKDKNVLLSTKEQ
jgi:hypothetical protein